MTVTARFCGGRHRDIRSPKVFPRRSWLTPTRPTENSLTYQNPTKRSLSVPSADQRCSVRACPIDAGADASFTSALATKNTRSTITPISNASSRTPPGGQPAPNDMPLRLLPTPPPSEIPHLFVLHSWRSYRPRSRLSTLSKTNYRCSSERLKSEEDNQWLTRL